MSDPQVIIEELQKKNRELIGKLAILQKQFDDALAVTHSFDGISAKNTELEKEIHNYISKNDDLTRRIQILSQTNAELTKKYDEEKSNWQSHKRCEINDLQNQLQRCQSDHEKEIISLKLKIDQSEKEHSFAVENYQKEIRRIYDAASQFLGTPIRETDTLITLLLSKTNTNQTSNSQQNSLQCPQCIHAKVDVRSKDQSLKVIRSEIKSLKNQTLKLNSITRDQATSIETLANEKAELIEANRYLNCQLDDIQKSCEEQMKELQSRHKKLKSKLASSIQKVETLEKEKAANEEQSKSLKTAIFEKETEIQRLTNEVQKLTNQNAISDQTITNLKEKCQELDDSIQKNNQTFEDSQLETKKCQDALQALHKLINDQKDEIHSMESQRSKLISQFKVLNSVLEQYETHTSQNFSNVPGPTSQISLVYSQFPNDLNNLLLQISSNPDNRENARVQNAFSIIYNYYTNIINTLNQSISQYRNDLQMEQLKLNQMTDNFNRRLQNSIDSRNFNEIPNQNNRSHSTNTDINAQNGFSSQFDNGANNNRQNTSNLKNGSHDNNQYSINNPNPILQNGNNRLNLPPTNNMNDFGFIPQNQQQITSNNPNIPNGNNNPNILNGNNNIPHSPYPNRNNDNQPMFNPNNNNSNYPIDNNQVNLNPNNDKTSSFNTRNSNQSQLPNKNLENPSMVNGNNGFESPYSNNNNNSMAGLNPNGFNYFEQQQFSGLQKGNNNQNLPPNNNNKEFNANQGNQQQFPFNADDSNYRNENSQFNYNPSSTYPGNNVSGLANRPDYNNNAPSYNTNNRREFDQQNQSMEIYHKIEKIDRMKECQEQLHQRITERENELHEIFAILHVNCFLDAKTVLQQIQQDIELLQAKSRDRKNKIKEIVNEYQDYQTEAEERIEKANNTILKAKNKIQESEEDRNKERLQYENKIKELISLNDTIKQQLKSMKNEIEEGRECMKQMEKRHKDDCYRIEQEKEEITQTNKSLRSEICKKECVIQQLRSFTKYFAKKQSQKHTNEQEQMKEQMSELIDKLKLKNVELKKSMNEVKCKMNKTEQENMKSKKQITEYCNKIKELECELETFQKETERSKSIIESKHKAAMIAQETEKQSHIEECKYQVENAKRELMAYVGLQFCSIFNAKEQIDASNFESFIQRLRRKFESLISEENNIRRMLSLNSEDSIESAISVLLSRK